MSTPPVAAVLTDRIAAVYDRLTANAAPALSIRAATTLDAIAPYMGRASSALSAIARIAAAPFHGPLLLDYLTTRLRGVAGITQTDTPPCVITSDRQYNVPMFIDPRGASGPALTYLVRAIADAHNGITCTGITLNPRHKVDISYIVKKARAPLVIVNAAENMVTGDWSAMEREGSPLLLFIGRRVPVFMCKRPLRFIAIPLSDNVAIANDIALLASHIRSDPALRASMLLTLLTRKTEIQHGTGGILS